MQDDDKPPTDAPAPYDDKPPAAKNKRRIRNAPYRRDDWQLKERPAKPRSRNARWIAASRNRRAAQRVSLRVAVDYVAIPRMLVAEGFIDPENAADVMVFPEEVIELGGMTPERCAEALRVSEYDKSSRARRAQLRKIWGPRVQPPIYRLMTFYLCMQAKENYCYFC